MGFLLAFLVTLGVAPAAAAAGGTLSFVQATVVAPDAYARSLRFVDASGRNRSHTVSDAAAPRVGRLQPGDEVIVVLADAVVQDVRVAHAAASAPAATETATGTAEPDRAPSSDDTPWTVVPAAQMRPTWPNPYSRFYKGPKPAARPQRR
jgi:hypothetical protein